MGTASTCTILRVAVLVGWHSISCFSGWGWREILDTLENEYGIRHEDCDGRKNLLFIPKGNQKLLVAVDLEDVTWIN